MLRSTAQRLSAPRFEVAAALEQAALAELRERRPDRAIETNVEFWAAVILDFAEVPAHMMPAMFTCGRTAGWCAHILEQKQLGKLVRPAAIYTGPGPRKPEEVAELGVDRAQLMPPGRGAARFHHAPLPDRWVASARRRLLITAAHPAVPHSPVHRRRGCRRRSTAHPATRPSRRPPIRPGRR